LHVLLVNNIDLLGTGVKICVYQLNADTGFILSLDFRKTRLYRATN